MKLNLRLYLTLAFTLIATVPVVYLALWVEQTAFEKEVDAVREKHLLLAKNITAALERYAADVESTLLHLVTRKGSGTARLDAAEHKLAARFDIRSVDIVRIAGERISVERLTGMDAAPETLPSALVPLLKSAVPDKTGYSPVLGDDRGRPTIYIYRRLDEASVAIGALDTRYIVSLQKAISFGRKGHAAIVDHTGRVLAHPREAWEAEMKNISKVRPVKQMMAGNSGVTDFYSPAMKKDMVSGYTVVKGPGWGVMVPQPIDELKDRADDVFKIALAVGVAGLLSAIFLGWLLTGALVSVLGNFVSMTRRVQDGDLDARVGKHPRLTPEEFRELGRAFDGMAEHIQNDQKVMAQALQDARKADQAKSEFLANMSHELRTPLNAIIGFSAMIGRSEVRPERIEEYANDINYSGNHLLSMINDILNIAKIETGQMEFREEYVNLADLIRSSLKLVAPQAEEAGVDLMPLQVSESIPLVQVDTVKQRQIFVNLLSNAVKFTPRDGTVEIDLYGDADGGVIVEVRDTGIGMSAAEIEVALTPFGQVEQAHSRQHEGTGLGLPLTRRFVELQGGTFRIFSEPGKGTRVTIGYPAEKVGRQAA